MSDEKQLETLATVSLGHDKLTRLDLDIMQRGVDMANESPEAVQAFYDTEHGPSPYAAKMWPTDKRAQRLFITAYVGALEPRGLVIYAKEPERKKK